MTKNMLEWPNQDSKGYFYCIIFISSIVFGSRAYIIMVTYNCGVPRSLECAYVVDLWKWEPFYFHMMPKWPFWCSGGYYERACSFLGYRYQTRDSCIMITHLWSVSGALGRGTRLFVFRKNCNHQKDQKWLFVPQNGIKRVQTGLFQTISSWN